MKISACTPASLTQIPDILTNISQISNSYKLCQCYSEVLYLWKNIYFVLIIVVLLQKNQTIVFQTFAIIFLSWGAIQNIFFAINHGYYLNRRHATIHTSKYHREYISSTNFQQFILVQRPVVAHRFHSRSGQHLLRLDDGLNVDIAGLA